MEVTTATNIDGADMNILNEIDSQCDIQVEAKIEQIVMILAESPRTSRG